MLRGRSAGYALQRQLLALGVSCIVIAPSLTPVKPGVRIKTDKRDARKLAELFRAGLLTEVHPPSESDEALRDLCRCRDDVRVDLLRARHRLTKFLLRRHCIYRQTKHHWGSRHMAWLEQLRFDDAVSQATFDSYFLAVQQMEERQRQLDVRLAEFGAQEPYREPVAWLRCFKGIDTVTAVRVLAIADRAQERLCARYRRMSEHGKVHNKTIVAMARELTGYVWAVLHPAAAPTRS